MKQLLKILIVVCMGVAGCRDHDPDKFFELDNQPEIDTSKLRIRVYHTDEDGRLFIHVISASDLSQVSVSNLHTLWAGGTDILDLTPLKDTALQELNIEHTAVSNIDVLSSLNLTKLFMADTKVRSIAPLSGLKISELDISGAPIEDLHLLRDLPLKTLHLDRQQIHESLNVLKEIRTLEDIGIGGSLSEPASNVLKKFSASSEKNTN